MEKIIEEFNKKEFLELLEKLATAKGASLAEKPRREVLKGFLNNNGVETTEDSAGNLWVSFGQGSWKDAVIFDAHIDVVQKGYISKVEYENERIIGMGVGDNLTAVAMLALLGKVIVNEKLVLTRPLKLLFSVGEEGDGNLKGVRQVVKDRKIPPYLFVSFDLSFEEYSVSALGSKRYKVKVDCPGGHSWDDYGTPGAIDELFVFFEDLKKEFTMIESNNSGNLSFNIGTIKGGEGINSISKAAEATFEFRSVDYKLLEKLDSVTFETINRMAEKNDVDISCIVTGERPASHPVKPERIEPLAKKLLKKICENIMVVPRSTNINIPLVAGWPSICLGLCYSGRFHSEEEYVEIDSLVEGWKLLCSLCEELMFNLLEKI